MFKRMKYVIFMTITLLLGLVIYTLFRPSTYISQAVTSVIPVMKVQAFLSNYDCTFLRYYFIDLIWAFSLCCGLVSIFGTGIKDKAVCFVLTFLSGTAWEVGQYFGLISGTGDYLDVLMYLTGAGFCLLIILKEKRYEKD